VFNSVKIEVTPCLDKDGCAPRKDVMAYFENREIVFYHSDTFIDIENYSEPLQIMFNDYGTPLRIDTREEKIQDFFVQKLSFFSSYLGTENTFESFKMDRNVVSYQPHSGDSSPFLTINL
jgi:hypothetical protein